MTCSFKTAVMAALLSTGFISLAPNLLLFFFPSVSGSHAHHNLWLNMGQALAAGALLGDVFLHTLGHEIEPDGTSLYILLGFTIFMILDLFIRSMEQQEDHRITKKTGEEVDANNKLSHTVLLNLTADALHNFTDGLSIGASFAAAAATEENDDVTLQSLLASRGALATASIFLHEVPHELGDFAVLLKHGFTKNQAILAQFMTAIAAMIGTVVGVYAVELSGNAVVYATAGGFVYLGAVSILPEVLEEASSSARGGRNKVAIVLAFILGIGFLHAVHMMQDHSHDHHFGHSHAHHDHHHVVHHEEHGAHQHQHQHQHQHHRGEQALPKKLKQDMDHQHVHSMMTEARAHHGHSDHGEL